MPSGITSKFSFLMLYNRRNTNSYDFKKFKIIRNVKQNSSKVVVKIFLLLLKNKILVKIF